MHCNVQQSSPELADLVEETDFKSQSQYAPILIVLNLHNTYSLIIVIDKC